MYEVSRFDRQGRAADPARNGECCSRKDAKAVRTCSFLVLPLRLCVFAPLRETVLTVSNVE